MKRPFLIGLTSFLLQFFQLILTQIILRKLGLVLPVDLFGFAMILSAQFFSFAIAMSLMGWLPEKVKSDKVFGSLLLLKFFLTATFIYSESVLMFRSILFFFFSGLEYALLFAYARRASAGYNLNIPRLNALIYSGSALGLLIGEKLLFKFFSLSNLILTLSLFGVLVATYIFFDMSIARENAGQTHSLPGKPEQESVVNIYRGYAFVSGFLLFGGIFISYRLLKIYLRETADISAEITAISMLLGVLVSYLVSRIKTVSAAKMLRISTLSLTIGSVLFCFVAQHLTNLAFIPREIFVALLLAGISGATAFIYNIAFAATGGTHDSTQNLLIMNAWGSCLGALLFGVLLLPHLRIVITFQIFIGCLLLLWLFSLWKSLSYPMDTWKKYAFLFTGCAYVIFLMSQAARTEWYQEQISRQVSKLVRGETVESIAEVNFDVWTLTSATLGKTPVYHRLITNSYSMSGTMFPSKRYMKLMSYLGWLFAEAPKKALNIGYGTGLTAQALLEFDGLQNIDVVDITTAIQPLTALIHAREESKDPLQDARLNFRLGGVRDFLKQTDSHYDIITGEPPPPANSNISYLYTKDFFELVKVRLNQGGVFTYWLPIHSISRRATLKIIRTFCTVFENCDLFAGTETNLILVGYDLKSRTKQNLTDKFNSLKMTRFPADTALATAEQLFSLLVASKTQLMQNSQGYSLLSDDYSHIEEDYSRALADYKSFFQLYLPSQRATVEYCLQSAFVVSGFKLSQLSFDNIFMVEAATDSRLVLPAIVHAYNTNASPGTLAWLFGLDENLGRAIDSAGLPENHYLMILRFAVREFQKRKPHEVLKHMRKFPMEIRMDKRLTKIWYLLEKLNVR